MGRGYPAPPVWKEASQRSIALALAVASVALLAACGGGAGAADEATPTSTPPATSTPTAPVPSYLDGAIALELILPTEVRQGERLEGLDVVMTNVGETTRTFYYSGDLLNFEAADRSGRLVWRHLGAWVKPLLTFELEPGESKLMSELDHASQGRWHLRDREGFPVEPGTYEVHGIVTIFLDDSVVDSTRVLETPQRTLTVLPAGLPEYAQSLELQLTAPAEAMAGDLIPMDLRLTNTGDRPLVFWWSGGSIYPPPNYLDVVIFKDGEAIWRATAAHAIRYQGSEPLAPTESRTLSSLFEGYGDPWTWDLHANCGESRFERCESPVAPGIYTVRGMANVSPPETLDQEPRFDPERTVVVTEQTLVVRAPTATLPPTAVLQQHQAGTSERFGCVQTLVGYFGRFEVVPGLDALPSGPDPANVMVCSYERAVASVSVILVSGETELVRTHHFVSSVTTLSFPLADDVLGKIPPDLPLGEYHREIRVTFEDGETETLNVVSDTVYLVAERSVPVRPFMTTPVPSPTPTDTRLVVAVSEKIGPQLTPMLEAFADEQRIEVVMWSRGANALVDRLMAEHTAASYAFDVAFLDAASSDRLSRFGAVESSFSLEIESLRGWKIVAMRHARNQNSTALFLDWLGAEGARIETLTSVPTPTPTPNPTPTEAR